MDSSIPFMHHGPSGPHIGVRAPSGLRKGGGGDLIAGKNYKMPGNVSVVQTLPNLSKTKTFTILTSNEPIIIPKTQRNSDFWNLRGKRKRRVREIGGKIIQVIGRIEKKRV